MLRQASEHSRFWLVLEAHPLVQEPDMEFDHDINVLNTLITTTIDSANGFERSAEDAVSPRFVDMFR